MTENRSVEDELVAEVRRFGTAMTTAIRKHAQARNWLERRRARRQISQILRQEQREEQVLRQHQLAWTGQAVDRYRAHSLAVTQRANDPSVDHARRWRDQQALEHHAGDLRGLILRNSRLTQVEQGIALDGIDIATAFPQQERPGRMLAQAHKVRGVHALRYRAQVARAAQTQREWENFPRLPERLHAAPVTEFDQSLPVQDNPAHARSRRARAAQLAREELSAPGAWIGEEDRRPDQDVEADLTRAYENSLFAQEQADRARAAAQAAPVTEHEFASLKDRHRVATQHNSALVNRNAELVEQVSALIAERDQLRDGYTARGAEIARLEIERDELRDTATTLIDQLAGHRNGHGHEEMQRRRAAAATAEHPRKSEREASDSVERLSAEAAAFRAAEWAKTQQQKMNDLGAEKYYAEADARWTERQHTGEPEAERTRERDTGQPIPGHAFAGLVNGRDREQEMER